MKKFLSVLLVALMVVSCLTMVAFAGEDDTYTVNFTVTGNPGFSEYQAKINYDHSALTLVDVKVGTVTGGHFLGNPSAVNTHASDYTLVGDVTDDGIVFTAVFKLTADATPGTTYNVTAEFTKIKNDNGGDVSLTVSGGSITAPEAEQPTPTDEPTPSEKPDPTDEPTPSEKPDPTDEPTPSEKPNPTDEPTPSEKPDPTDEPTPSEKPNPSDKPDGGNKPSGGNKPGNKTPKTGDESNFVLWAVILLVACGGVAVVVTTRKKNN